MLHAKSPKWYPAAGRVQRLGDAPAASGSHSDCCPKRCKWATAAAWTALTLASSPAVRWLAARQCCRPSGESCNGGEEWVNSCLIESTVTYLGKPADEPRCSRFVVRRLFVKSREGNGMGRSSWLAYICMAPSSRPS